MSGAAVDVRASGPTASSCSLAPHAVRWLPTSFIPPADAMEVDPFAAAITPTFRVADWRSWLPPDLHGLQLAERTTKHLDRDWTDAGPLGIV